MREENAYRVVTRRKAWIGIAAAIAALAFASPSFGGTFQVNVTSDGTTVPPDCNVLGQTGTCTLRDAITLANLDPGPNTIDFAIGGSPPQIITLTSTLPALTKPTTINGASQTGYAGTPLIVLDGSNLTSGFGLELDGAGGGVIALDFANFQNGVTAALYLHGGGAAVTGNYIGVDSSGTGPVRNQVGIQADTANNTIGGTTTAARNVISGNGLGILISGTGATANVIQGNYVGLDAAGTNGIFGSGEAITVDGGASGTTIGGTTVAARNVISGQGQNAITFGLATGNVVKGNFIGPLANDTSAIGNDIAVQFDSGADSNTIGSAGAGANVMAGSFDVAILVSGGKNNAIAGNLIGTDLAGTPFSFANDQGVRILSGDGNTFSHNRISTSNQQGIEIDAGGNTFTANRVDSNDNGGIIVNAGGSTIGPGNTIVASQGFGIQVTAGNSTRITQNSIDGTVGGKGIQLFESVNNNAIAPVLTAAAGSGSNIQIQGTLDSTPSEDFAVEFFRSAGCNSSGFGEGATYLGTASGAADGSGHLDLDSTFPAVGSGSTITATATDSVGNTSEFSACATMTGSTVSVFTVTTTDDADSGSCTISHCSLREAIGAANASLGTDAIVFDISPGGLQTIKPSGGLPAISDKVSIDGTTQPGTAVGSPGIELNGSQIDGTANGLQIDAGGGGSTVRGLVIDRFSEAGILLDDPGNTVAGNYIGTEATGTDNGANLTGIVVTSSGNVIGGTTAADRNVISGNTGDGILLQGGNNVVKGNTIGLAASSDTALANGGSGVTVDSGAASANTIGDTSGGGNVISGNGENGILLSQLTANPGTVVAGNHIGTNETGTAAIGNGGDGIHFNDGAFVTVNANTISGNQNNGIQIFGFDSHDNLIEHNRIGTNDGGTGAIANSEDGILVDESSPNTIDANVVSGNNNIGIEVGGPNPEGASGNVVTGNLVGVNAAGTAAIGNAGDGIRVAGATDTTIGGATAPARNVVGGSGGHGIHLSFADSNLVQGNYTGVNATGTSALPNTLDGIAVDESSSNAITGNVASGNNNQGIAIFNVGGDTTPNANIVRGNRTGLAATGTAVVANGGDGIRVFDGTNTTIGGVAAGQGNESAGNGKNGVVIIGAVSTGNSIRGNAIHDNVALGIDLSAAVNPTDGVTPNDPDDADTGANNLQNFPVLTTATVNATSTQITGSLDSALGSYVIDFYASSASPGCDLSGNGEGARWLGSSVVKTGNGALISIDTGTHITASVSPGELITATATDSAGNTSEFSTCLVAEAGLPGLALTSDEASVPAGAANIPLSSVPPAMLGLLASAPIPNSPIPNSAVGAAPIPNSPIPNSPIPNSPIANSPIANSPIANSGVDGIPASILATIPLSSIPIDWTPIFAGTSEANVPTPSLTLLDVFNVPAALARFNALPLSQLHLEGSLLRGVRFSSLLYGGITIDKIKPYSLSEWCNLLSSCTGIDVTKVTVLGLDVAGLLDATSLGAVTVGEVHDFTSATSPIPNSPIPNSPIPNSPIANSPIANSSVPLTVIGSVVIGTLAVPSNVVDCTKLTSCLTKTLADAANANAIKPTATYQDLLRPNANHVYPLANVNFNAFAIALIGIENLPWESWPFDGFQEFAGTGNVVHYHLTAPAPCGTTYRLRVILPHGFLVKRGSSALAVGTGAAAPIPDPATDPITGATWTLPALNCAVGQAVRLDFQGLAGFRLGEQSATAQLIVGASIKTANASITVTQNNEPDSNPATAPVIQPNTLAVGHIPTSDDLDWRSFSTTGLPRGTKVTVYLRPPVGTDLDVYLTKPSSPTLLSSTSPIPNSPIPNSPIPNSPLPDNGGSLGATTDNPQPEGLQDAPIANSAIASAGITRGDGVEVAQVVLGGDENGPVKILVAGYNGAHSPDAYTLRVKVVTPPQLPACLARTYAFPNVTNQGTLPASIPSTKQNLFIMNFGATAKAYGLTAANSLLAKLNTVAARTDVNGAVLQVDGDAAVRTAKAAWDASPCSTAAANDVVRKINAVVARYRAQATGVQSVTIVGGDELVPMARIADLTTDANEASAVGDLIFTTNGLTRANALFASEFLGNTLTDDAYTAGTTIPWFGRELYLPQIAGGRLVETPAEIMGQLDQYISSNGILAPTTAVVSGYDFMKDEAGQISTELRSTTARNVSVDTTSLVGAPLIGDAWTKTDLQPFFSSSTAQRGIVSANGHYNHWEAAPASRPAASPPPLPLTSADLISTAVLPLLGATQLQDAGSILFTMGCHAGLNVSNTFPSGTTPERLRDWAQAWSQNKVAVYVANTGYGYGDYDAIVLSERLMAMFAHNLASDGSIGRKLVLAKQQYFGSIASYDPYAEKALAEATFYGLPFYRVGTGAEASDPAPVATGFDPEGTGVQVATIGITPDLTLNPTARGTYWSNTADGGVEYLKDRPVEPRLSQEVTTNGGLRAHGVRITELTTHDELNIDPLIATPMIDLSAHEPEARVRNITFPATFATIDHWTAFGANHDSLVVDAGQTRPGVGTGETQRLVTHIKLDVLYSASNDFAPPLLSSVGSVVNGTTATLFAHTSDSSGVARVVAFYTEGGAVWKFVTLHYVGGDLYTGTAAVTVPKIESAFSSQDTVGNVGYSTDKGTLFTSLTGDSEPPEVTIASPIDNATYTFGQSVSASFACSDDGGVSSCVGDPVANGAVVDTSNLGQHSFSVTATDLTGNRVTVTVNYTVAIYGFKGFFSPIHNPPDLNVVKAGSAVPIKFSLTGNQGLLIFAPNSPASRAISCDPNVPQTPVPTSTSGGSTLSYDPSSDTYTYSWKTDSTWRGTCRQLVVTLRDGSTHLANFKFSN